MENNIFKDSYHKKNQVWLVSTEGDCEGRSMRSLGYFQGNIAEIALYLADRACYTLEFAAVEVQPVGVPTGETIDVSFKYNAYTSPDKIAMAKEMQTIVGPDFIVRAGDHYASVKITARKPLDPQAILRQKALEKLSPEEIEALGL